MRILIVDDEINLANVLKVVLMDAGYVCDVCYDGRTALEKILKDVYDGIILDIMLPKKNGYEVLQEIRKNNLDVPILILSALSEVEDTVLGLNLGANDYMSKPFSTKELLARMRVMLKQNNVEDIYFQYNDILLSKKEDTISCKNMQLQLSKKESAFLSLLIQSQNQEIPLWRILEKVWNNVVDVDENTIQLYASYLNRKLKALQSKVYIKIKQGNVKLCVKI